MVQGSAYLDNRGTRETGRTEGWLGGGVNDGLGLGERIEGLVFTVPDQPEELVYGFPTTREELKKRNMPTLTGNSPRALFAAMVRGESWTEGRFIHLFREGTLEICSAEEARAYWKRAR